MNSSVQRPYSNYYRNECLPNFMKISQPLDCEYNIIKQYVHTVVLYKTTQTIFWRPGLVLLNASGPEYYRDDHMSSSFTLWNFANRV